MFRMITKTEATSIPGRWRVTLECRHVRFVSRPKRPTNRVACGECQLDVNGSRSEIEQLAKELHERGRPTQAWSACSEGYRDVLRGEAAERLARVRRPPRETKVSKAG